MKTFTQTTEQVRRRIIETDAQSQREQSAINYLKRLSEFLRKIFRKKEPRKILELTTNESQNHKKTHNFVNFTDTHYCKIMEFHSDKRSDGLVNLNIAWRTSNKVYEGDIFILHTGASTKTFRIKKILDDKSDVKLGVALSLQ